MTAYLITLSKTHPIFAFMILMKENTENGEIFIFKNDSVHSNLWS